MFQVPVRECSVILENEGIDPRGMCGRPNAAWWLMVH